jgi:hypothetical protein
MTPAGFTDDEISLLDGLLACSIEDPDFKNWDPEIQDLYRSMVREGQRHVRWRTAFARWKAGQQK